jgi:hypothetical protein
MKMITKQIENSIPALYSTENTAEAKKAIAVKFFTPWTSWTWYAVEGERREDGDFLFFGLVDGQDREWGYFTLSQLESVTGPMGLKIERDRHFENKTIADLNWRDREN